MSVPLAQVESLMSFLKSEVENEERITIAIRGFNLEGSASGAKSQKMSPAAAARELFL
jgi:hypothetical protein